MSEIETISTTELAHKWNAMARQDFGWVMYRFPGKQEINFTAGSILENIKASSGFVIAPFYHPHNKVWCIENKMQFQLSDTDFSEIATALNFQYSENKGETSSSKSGYMKLVEGVIAEIGKGNMQKAVPARMRQVVPGHHFTPLGLFKSILEAYPNAFVYLLSTPQTGVWMGCTPEMLLKVNDGTLNTLSLAGTKKTESAESKAFSSKETEEQVIVTRYIYDILQRYCIGIEADGPKVISAGNVNHLATYFKGHLKPEYEQNYLQVLNDLHPTPAVCGMPLRASRDFLLKHESFDRSLYSGFLGPVSESKVDIFVNLRCMQVFEHSAQLYAGAGVVKGSVPENEWFETEEKMNTLLRFL